MIPICYRSCDWDGLPIASLQSPVSGWIKSSGDEDVAWTQVSQGLKPAIAKAKQRKLASKENRKHGLKDDVVHSSVGEPVG